MSSEYRVHQHRHSKRSRSLAGWLLVGSLALSSQLLGQNPTPAPSGRTVEWEVGLLLQGGGAAFTKTGEPQVLETPMGRVATFDGVDDGIFLDAQPLVGLREFTVEAIIKPDPDGLPEQRFLHIGETRGSRLMLETRLTKENQWYLDAYVRSETHGKTMIDSTKLHGTGMWQVITFVFDDGQMDTYVDGVHELSDTVAFTPFTSGQTSIGVRQNKVSWFKGAIWKIRITPRILSPHEFLKIGR